VAKTVPTKTNAARGPATLEPHRSWTFKAAFPSLRAAGTTVPVRQRSHSQRAPHLPALLQTCDSENSCPATSVVASSPTQLKERGVEEAAMPGQPARAHARFRFPTGNSRSRIAGLPPASPQSSFGASLEVPTYLVETLCGRSFRVAIEKRSPVVQKLWTPILLCGRLRKSGRNYTGKLRRHSEINNLDAVKQIPPSLTGTLRRRPGCCRYDPKQKAMSGVSEISLFELRAPSFRNRLDHSGLQH